MSIRYFATNRNRENLGHTVNRTTRHNLEKGGYHFVNMEAYMSYYLATIDETKMPSGVYVENSQADIYENFLGHEKVGKVVICVHGFNVHFHDAQTWFGILTDSLRKTASLGGKIVSDPIRQDKALLNDQGIDDGSLTVFIGFSWPSNGNAFSYPSDQKEALSSAPALASLIKRIRDLGNKPSVNLICHSMGNFLACNMFKNLNEDANWENKKLVDHYIMLAPDVERRHVTQCAVQGNTIYKGPYFPGLRDLVGRTYNFYSRFDGALAISNIEKGPRKVMANAKGLFDKLTFGIVDFLERNPDEKWEERLGATQHPMIAPPNMSSHNATELSGREIGHSDYVDSEEIAEEIAKIISDAIVDT